METDGLTVAGDGTPIREDGDRTGPDHPPRIWVPIVQQTGHAF